MAKILVVEDDEPIRLGLVDLLEGAGYDVIAAPDGDAALAQFPESKADLILLDVMMPKISGYEVCQIIRERDRQVPIIMLTAKSEELDKVRGLQLGADDYVTKPFGVRELLARVAAVLRRHDITQERERGAPESFKFGTAEIDAKRFEVTVAGSTQCLTARELTLIRLFHAKPGEVLTRDYLLDQAWGIQYRGTTRTLDQHIVQLRKKVEVTPASPETILTVHGTGYRYRA